ncbi:hypothetical protein [Streptomyces sp. 1114.5]|uniref:hypothetical protein n=1 Tax=Streptomyces sp. 1114.5 TaxID=1938830 RepID=UPI0015FF967B|nr:hypothetical protein [Streptomyces sp. 1114.5]
MGTPGHAADRCRGGYRAELQVPDVRADDSRQHIALRPAQVSGNELNTAAETM